MKKMLLLAVAFSVLFVSNSWAAMYVVYGVKLYTYAQSTNESQAHLVRSSKGIFNDNTHPWCGNRVYIEFEDVDLYQRALSSELAGQTVNIMYEDAAESRFINGHVQTQCKLLSIWR